MRKLLALLLLAPCALIAQVPDYVPTDGLVTWYPLDGDATDESTLGLDGTVDGTTPGTNRFGEAGKALYFDGSASVTCPSQNFPNGLTVSLWVQESEINGVSGFVFKYDGDYGGGDNSIERTFAVYRHGNNLGNRYYATASETGVAFEEFPTQAVGSLDWVHLTTVFGLDGIQYYVNGALDTDYTFNSIGGYHSSDVPITLGCSYPTVGDNNKLIGTLDDIGIWNRALTPSEVLALFSATEENSTPNPSDAGWEYLGEEGLSTYWVLNEDMLWSEAMNLCEQAGGVLYWPNSMEEHMQVWSWVQQGNDGITYWTGVHQDFSQSPCSTTGNWIGPTGEAQTYFNWEPPHEPNNAGGGESVAQFEWSNDGAYWNDAPGQDCDNFNCPCSYARPILELASALVISACTDPEACNYDAEANVDDGSCYSCDVPASHCGPGTHWDATLSACVADVPSAEAAENCTLMSLQELTEGYLNLLDIVAYQDSLLAAQQGGNQDNGDGTTDNWTCGAPLPYQGYDYATVQIGNQCWFAENLRSTQYANGEGIPDELSDAQWSGTTSGARSVYGEGTSACTEAAPGFNACDAAASLTEYGRLYNWFSVNDPDGLCPSGWSVPNNEDWTALVNAHGGMNAAGDALKSDAGWDLGLNGNNSSGFNGLPAGYRAHGDGSFQSAGHYAIWWSTTETSGTQASIWGLNANVPDIDQYSDYKPWGLSVRCLRD